MAHILVVDDDRDLCALLRTALERDGHQVSTRLSGGQVDEAACRWADCILLDGDDARGGRLRHLPPRRGWRTAPSSS